jgi:hypothetical protein
MDDQREEELAGVDFQLVKVDRGAPLLLVERLASPDLGRLPILAVQRLGESVANASEIERIADLRSGPGLLVRVGDELLVVLLLLLDGVDVVAGTGLPDADEGAHSIILIANSTPCK